MNLVTPPPLLLVSFFFLLQLFFISFYISGTWRKQRSILIKGYPQKTFPNLYAQPEQIELKRLDIRRLFDLVILTIGLVAMICIWLLNADPYTTSRIMIGLAALQLLPMFLSGYWCQQNSNILSKKHPKKIRSTQLIPHKLSDYISINKAIISAIIYACSVMMGVYLYIIGADNGNTYKPLLLVLLSTVAILFVGYILVKITIGDKKDHFIENEERSEKAIEQANFLILIIGVYSAFILILQLFSLFEIHNTYINIITSLFVQGFVFRSRNQYYPVNPSVYK